MLISEYIRLIITRTSHKIAFFNSLDITLTIINDIMCKDQLLSAANID